MQVKIHHIILLFASYAFFSHWYYVSKLNKANKFIDNKIEQVQIQVDSIKILKSEVVKESKKTHKKFIKSTNSNHSKLLENEKIIRNTPVSDTIIDRMLSKYGR